MARSSRLWLLFVLTVATLCQGLWGMRRPVDASGDAPSYIRPATELAEHHGFRGANPVAFAFDHPLNARAGGPETIRTPGYPLFLALFLAAGLPLAAAIVVQHLLAVALAAAVFLFVDVVLRRPMAAVVAGTLIATQPALQQLAHEYMSDVLSAAVVAATMFCVVRVLRGGAMRWTVAAAVLAGCATLIRPIALFWFVPLAVIIATRNWRRATVFTLITVAAPVLWIARNHAETGVATISSVAGENMLCARAAGVLALEGKPLSFQLTAIQQPTGVTLPQQKIERRLVEMALVEARRDGVDVASAPHAVLARYYGRLGLRVVLHHLPESAALACSAMTEMFACTYVRSAMMWSSSPMLPVALWLGVALFAVACFGFAVLCREDPRLAALIGVTILYFAALSSGLEGDPRMALQFLPPYAVAAGVGVEQLIVRRHTWRVPLLVATPERRLLLVALAVRIVPAMFVFGTEDIGGWESWGRALATGGNPYATGFLIAWPPLWLPFATFAYQTSSLMLLPFPFVAKLFPIAGDVIIVFLLYDCARRFGLRPYRTAMLYALNPISIYTSALHGNFDTIPALCTLAAVNAVAPQTAAIWTGVGGAFKTWPIFILPAIVARLQTWRLRLITAAIAVGILAAAFLIPVPFAGWATISNALRYRGTSMWWGLTAIGFLRGTPLDEGTARAVFYVAMAGAALLLFVRPVEPPRGALFLLLTFLVATPGFGLQYLVWVVPVALIADQRRAVLYTIVGGLLIAYEIFLRPYTGHPGEILRYLPHTGFARAYGQGADRARTATARLTLWAFALYWWVVTLVAIARARREGSSGPSKMKLV